jgi:hypothetical protein
MPIGSARTTKKTPSSFVKDACLQLCCLATDVLLFRGFAWRGPHRKHSFPYIVVTFWTAVFTGSSSIVACIVAVRMFMGIPLLLRSLATDCLPRICLRGNLFTNPLPGNGCTCNNIMQCNSISGFEGSQAVSACPCGIGNAYCRNFFILLWRSRGCVSKIEANVGRAILGRNFDVTIGRAACEANSYQLK